MQDKTEKLPLLTFLNRETEKLKNLVAKGEKELPCKMICCSDAVEATECINVNMIYVYIINIYNYCYMVLA